jgi:RNA polymerase sigma-70 factor (ECF subfamily)
MSTDAQQLIRAYCERADQGAFRTFYREQSPRLWKFLLARGGEREAAYDLVAEAFLRFIQTVCRDPRAPVALLYRIALNLRIDQYRHDRAAPHVAVADPAALGVAAAAEPDEYQHLRALLTTLPEPEQNLLLLRYWIGLSHKETAQALAVPEGTVRRQCAEALEKLRVRWERHDKRYGIG